jgi:pimeloyl-ACP methyl ester carboxylesterase
MWRSFPLLSPFARLDARDGISSELKSEVRVTFRDAQGRVEQTSTVPQYRFFAADYRSTNQSAIVGDDGGNRDRVRRQSEDMLRGLLARGVLASKFDVIAHSMGAPIVRAMHGDDQGPVRRFITLDGVHQGSMLADCLYENRDERFRFLTPEPPFCTETSLAAVTQFLPEGVAGLVATGLQQVVVNLVARFVPGLAEALEAAPFPDLVRSAFHNMVFMDLSRGAIRDLQTTAGPWPRMTSADVHTMVGVFDGDLQARVVTASLFEAVAKPLMLAVAEQLAEPFCTGVEFEPAFFRRPWPDYIYGYSLDGYFGLPIGIAGPHDVAVSSYSQAGGLQNDECSVFRSELPDPLVTPSPNGLTHVTCRAEVLEEAARFSPLGRKFGSKHLTGPIPGRAIYESQAVALKVGWLLDLGDPEHDELGGELPSYGGTFRRGFPFAGRETRGCSAP